MRIFYRFGVAGLIRTPTHKYYFSLNPTIKCWFSHDVTKFQTSELLTLLRFFFHDE